MNQNSENQTGFSVADRTIGDGSSPFIVAEISGNHAGDFERACELIEAAADAGADAVKFQTYEARTLTIDNGGDAFIVNTTLWQGRSLFELYTEAQTPFAWHAALFEKAASAGIIAFSAPFDLTAVELLEGLDCPLYKIASCELVDLPLIRAVAQTGKPVIMSTGMATFEEIAEALATAREAGARDIALLHCVSGYPSTASDANLATLQALGNRFGTVVGLSDHSPGITVPVSAVTLGAAIVEKHLCLERDDGSVDSAFSLTPDEFGLLVRACKDAHAAKGSVLDGPIAAETDSLRFRRSLFVVEAIKAGDVFSERHIRSIRPAGGLHTRHLADVIGAAARRDVSAGTPLAWDMVDKQDRKP